MVKHYQKASFLLSVADINQLPSDQGIEVAIVGSSNAGKSSILNRLTQNKQLARVSKTPGRTQLLNMFGLDDERRLVDLPGYGYAKAPLTQKRKWEKTINEYFEIRESLKGLILVMDIRHPFKPLDHQLLMYCEHRQLPVHIVLNKMDKLTNQQVATTFKEAAKVLTEYTNSVTFQGSSALKNKGMEELRAKLDEWYQFDY